jgi:[protein-PII] uridylyltransferase
MYSEAVRQLLVHHLEECAERLECEDLAEQICLVAVGGFGRYELGIFSDLDFLFVTEVEPTTREKEFITAVLYPLFDLKVDLGYAIHSVKGCLQTLGTDLHRTTSLLETRYIWGEATIGEELTERVHSRLRRSHMLWFVESLHAETKLRHERAGGTVYLLEPDVKDSCGCLRDIHQILWLAITLYGAADLDVLAENGLVSEEERQKLLDARSYLLTLRNRLHLIENRRMDKMTLDRQIQLARYMGHEATDLALAEERLMRTFYGHASHVDKLSRRLTETVLRRTPGTPQHAQRTESPHRVDRDFWLQGHRLWIEERELDSVRVDDYWPFRLFLAAAREGVQPSDATLRHVEEALPSITDRVRRSPQARDLFLNILNTPGRIAETLRTMNRCGLLSAYIQEFASVRNLPRLDHYHQYTVDEHMIRAVEIAERLQSEKGVAGMEHVSQVTRELLRPDLLHMALLFHDVGKGEGRGHVIRGMHAIQRIAERMEMRAIEKDILRLLVANHQKMTHMVMKRDIEDPGLARELAEATRFPEVLRMLYVHSACDLAAVSTASWNDWRGRLLAQLFERTLDVMRGITHVPSAPAPADELIAKIWAEVKNLAGENVPERFLLNQFFSDMPERYLRSVSPRDMARHFLLSTQVNQKNRVAFHTAVYEDSDYVEITFAAGDAPGLFSSLCGAMAAKNFNILSAQVYTAHSGEAIDIFQVQVPPAFCPTLDDTLARICKQLTKMIETGERPKWLSGLRGSTIPVTRDRLDLRPPRVEINNEMAPGHTVVEVRSPDRPGLLSRIAEVFDEQGVNIDLAFIATESYQVVDVFYVTDLETNKLQEERRLKTLHDALMKAILEGIEKPATE